MNVAKELSIKQPQADLILLDCLTLLVSNLLVTSGQKEGDLYYEEHGRAMVAGEINQLLDFILCSDADWIVVSNEVGMGLVPPYPLGRLYRDLLGWTNQQFAGKADNVLFMVAGLPWQLTQLDG
jgi:adenosylcobinamide kinase/adenosylcobinamide-phosphate guanylyltransferase